MISMKEYGGYIEFEHFHGEEFHKNAIALNSGRHCVEYLIKANNIKKIYIPSYLCNSINEICIRLGVETEYYHIDINFKPIFDNMLNMLHENDWLYIVNYYGQLTNEFIYELKQKYNNIIVDNVQAFFQLPVFGVDTLYSCRKFFGVADGGYLYSNTILNEEIDVDYSYGRMNFLLGRYEKEASLFYNEYRDNNKIFGHIPMRQMSTLTHNLLRGIDYEQIKDKRNQNFDYLHKRFKKNNKLSLSVPEGAFMYPLYIEKGEDIRKQLQQMKIYIPTLWPDVFNINCESDVEYDMALNILPIPCDQRYSFQDMKYINETIEKIMEDYRNV